MLDQTNVFGTVELITPKEDADLVRSNAVANVSAVLFDSFKIDLQPGQDCLSESKLYSFRIPIQIPEEKSVIGYMQTLGFGVQQSTGARVVIVADLAGTTNVLEFPYGRNPDEPLTPLLFRRFFSVQGLDLATQDGMGLEVPPPYEASLMISVQRRQFPVRHLNPLKGIG
ncbi:MAG: hypothetical protein HY774_24435 [Acidobacteria bacterium]|nr:hypothetical protein [Acidobacteriota bacterium]